MTRILALFLLLLPLSAEAETRQETLTRIESYLNGLTTIQSDFTQIAPDGSLSEGTFYLQRPGKMRWEYKPPTPVLMISDGTALTYIDTELEQVTAIPLDSTLAGFLAQKKISFADKAIKILVLEAKEGMVRVKVTQAAKPGEGELTLEFSDQPLTLRNMLVKDAGGQVTNVALNNAEYGGKLDPKLFVFRDPRIYGKKKR